MRLFLFFAVMSACLLHGKPTRTLADAASRVIRHFPQGSVVTAEIRSGEPEPTFAMAGQTSGLEVSPECLPFELGNLGEVFNALLLSIAVHESRVSLDSTLAQLLEPRHTFQSPSIGSITLRDLATHRSGLPHQLPSLSDSALKGEAQSDLKAWWQQLDTLSVPRAPKYQKSELGQDLLGQVLAEIYGMSWEALLSQKICEPLGLQRTFIPKSGEALLVGYQGASMPSASKSGGLTAWRALRSTAQDLVILAQALLHPQTSALEDPHRALLERQTEQGPELGLGWEFLTFYDEPTLECQGGSAGFRAFLQLLPKSGELRVVLTNQAQLEPERIMNALVQRPAPPLASQRKLSDAELQPHEGRYETDSGEIYDLVTFRKQLWIKARGGSFAPLFVHDEPARFFLKNEPVQLEFEHASQRVTLFTFQSLGRRRVARKTADDSKSPYTLRSSKELEPLLGTYTGPDATSLSIRAEALQLQVQLGDAAPLRLHADASQALSYSSDVSPISLHFEAGAQRSIERLVWTQGDKSFTATKTHPAPTSHSP